MEKETYTKKEVSDLLDAKDKEWEAKWTAREREIKALVAAEVKKAVAEALETKEREEREAKEREERCALLLQERAYFRTLTGPCRHNMLYFNDVRT
jgi:Skp family chaperone for outer membrane proteins